MFMVRSSHNREGRSKDDTWELNQPEMAQIGRATRLRLEGMTPLRCCHLRTHSQNADSFRIPLADVLSNNAVVLAVPSPILIINEHTSGSFGRSFDWNNGFDGECVHCRAGVDGECIRGAYVE